jgi:hypothetical protein
MKKILFILSFVCYLVFVGCSENEESPSEPTDNAQAEQVYDEVVKPQEAVI